jgi:glycosyltransferase involved in cell wall biosynthesis
MKLSVAAPKFNEKATIHTILERTEQSEFEKEIVLIDDSFTDGTRQDL